MRHIGVRDLICARYGILLLPLYSISTKPYGILVVPDLRILYLPRISGILPPIVCVADVCVWITESWAMRYAV